MPVPSRREPELGFWDHVVDAVTSPLDCCVSSRDGAYKGAAAAAGAEEPSLLSRLPNPFRETVTGRAPTLFSPVPTQGLKNWDFPDSEATFKSIEGSLQRHFLLCKWTTGQRRQLIKTMEKVECRAGSKVITQGEEGFYMYIVEKGKFDVLIDGSKVAEKVAGDWFGDLALIFQHQRTASVVAAEHSIIWALQRDTFRNTMAETSFSDPIIQEGVLAAMDVFKNMTSEQRIALIHCAQTATFNEDEEIFTEGKKGDAFYIIQQGRVVLTQSHGTSGKDTMLTKHPLRPGDYFGENAIMYDDSRRNATAMTVGDESVTCLMFPKKDIPRELLPTLQHELQRLQTKRVIREIPLFHTMSPAATERLADAMTLRTFALKEMIVTQGERGDTMYIIRQGTVVITQTASGGGHRVLTRLYAGDFFGEMSMLEDVTRQANCISGTANTECFEISRETFGRVMPANVIEEIKKTEAKRKAMNDGIAAMPKREDFEQAGVIGTGKHSVVKLVRHIATQKQYALRQIRKSTVVEQKMHKHLRSEIEVLSKVNDCAYITPLVNTFMDRNNIFLQYELVDGCEFTAALSAQGGTLSGYAARYYLACIVCALEKLHSFGFAYRDLKPDNCMVDKKGVLKLVNFGCTAPVSTGGRRMSVVGTPEYMSPEVIAGSKGGHDMTTDCWSLGVLAFEIMSGFTPFNPWGGSSAMGTFAAIASGKFKFPDNVEAFDTEAKSLISGLLTVDPAKRLGSRQKGGWTTVKEHPYFHSKVAWNRIEKADVKPPWAPTRMKHETIRLPKDDPRIAPPVPWNGNNKQFDYIQQ